jgi:FAD dependent oxidoreductase
MNRLPTREIISEPARKVKVFAEAQVVIVGGGPGGVSAAIAAAREGADTILVERYGHLGGMATGGLVLMLSEFPAGQCQEWKDRLKPLGGLRDISQTREPGISRHTFMVDPELLKCILNDMAGQAGVRLLLHSWGAGAIVEQNSVKGIIFESKSGRQAVLGEVIIDATGDGDIFASAGADFDGNIDQAYRSSQMAMVFRIGNLDFDKFSDFRINSPEKWQEIRNEVDAVAGFHIGPVPASRSDVVWVNSFIKGLSPIKVEDLTSVETNVRKAMIPIYEYYKKRVPGFENSYIYDSASQIGTRGSRRLIGEYVLNKQDLESRKTFNDTVGVFSRGAGPKSPANVGLPYRCLVPVKMDGLLVAGRCFSSDPVANNWFNVIHHCAIMGQAAGTAAALAVKNKVTPRAVDYKALRGRLSAQGVYLPG